jgi:hypothetical protein
LNKSQEGVSNQYRQRCRFPFGARRFAQLKPEDKNKTNKHMNRTQKTLLVAAAVTGLMTGVAVKTYAQDSTNAPGATAPSTDTGKHDCAGKNSCKGQGGCGGQKGTNSCKGQGGCNTNGSCKGKG